MQQSTAPAPNEEDERVRDVELLQMLGQQLMRRAEEQVRKRYEIEQRWMQDLRQYHGKYDPDVEAKMEATDSKIFANLTRAKTTTAEARLADMLFPSDDKNWGIQPTPVPELAAAMLDEGVYAGPDGQPHTDEQGQPLTHARMAQEAMKQAKRAAEGMQREIDDQLTEAGYASTARDVIHDACLYGAGIIKGPMVINRTRRAWRPVNDAGRTLHVLEEVAELRPGVARVDPWDYFPDMSARTKAECEFEFERRWVTKSDLRKIAKRPGVNKDQIRAVLESEPRAMIIDDSRLQERRAMGGVTSLLDDGKYELWEYHGPVEPDALRACGCEVSDDPLEQPTGIVRFVGNIVISADIHPMETGDSIYSIFHLEKDETSLFGYGVPFLMRSPQKVVNAAWRMILTNAGLSTGPQILVNRGLISPLDGSWRLVPRKVWTAKDPAVDVRAAFATFDIPSHQPELAAIFEAAKRLIDEETALPMLAQGEQGQATQTFQGMSLLMNAANIVLRRLVKQWDDDVTRGLIQRFYDYNMEHGVDPEIKGDFEVDARGSSALVVKEIQAQSLMAYAGLGNHPLFGPLIAEKAGVVLRKIAESMHLSSDEVVPTDDEIEVMKARMAEQGASDPMAALKAQELQIKAQALELQAAKQGAEHELAQMKLQADFADHEAEREARERLRRIELEIEQVQYAADQNLSLIKVQAEMNKARMMAASARDIKAADIMTRDKEFAIKTRMGSGI